jgi:uncharacterized SAM-binding protein YcdF (DUF218 family)
MLLLPPANLILVALAALLLSRPRRRLAAGGAFTALLALYAFSTPIFSAWLLMRLEGAPPVLEPSAEAAQAIVVLSAGTNAEAPEYGGRTIDALSLQRVRYAARLARLTGLPVLASGGSLRQDEPSVASLMAASLEQDFGVAPRWLEERSTDTHQNAEFSAEILRAAGIERIYLVTHSWHMPRALAAFERTGLQVTPAPTAFTDAPPLRLAFAPSTTALRHSYYALHELVGRLWYRLAYGV